MKEMATSTDHRHVPTTTLSMLAQRMGKVCASATTWSRLVRERRWRRPRTRLHPDRAKEGLRTKRPDEAWHLDTTVFRVLDGTKAYLQAVIDNYSRRILAWQIRSRLELAATAALLVRADEASTHRCPDRRSFQQFLDREVLALSQAVE